VSCGGLWAGLGPYSRHGRNDTNLKAVFHLEVLNVDGRIILKRNLIN
jgi:hypothetical protein